MKKDQAKTDAPKDKGQACLEAMFVGTSADEWRAIYAGAYDWGSDVGKEAIED